MATASPLPFCEQASRPQQPHTAVRLGPLASPRPEDQQVMSFPGRVEVADPATGVAHQRRSQDLYTKP